MIRIITDSSADFEPEELEKLNVICVPMSVSFGENIYQENINLSKDEFYNRLMQSEEIPHTSQPTPYDFMSVLENAMNSGDEAVLITLSSGLSGTYQGAVLAKNMLGYENCHIVDSLSATAGERILVKEAAKLRDEGKSASEIAFELERLRSRIVIYACMDTLEYLHKGGRISDVSYAVGTITHIKPIIHVTEEGKVKIPSKVIGKNKGVRYICDAIANEKPDTTYPMYVLYTHNRENAMKLMNKLQLQGYEILEENTLNVGAVIGTHIGPDAFGIAYVSA